MPLAVYCIMSSTRKLFAQPAPPEESVLVPPDWALILNPIPAKLNFSSNTTSAVNVLEAAVDLTDLISDKSYSVTLVIIIPCALPLIRSGSSCRN